MGNKYRIDNSNVPMKIGMKYWKNVDEEWVLAWLVSDIDK